MTREERETLLGFLAATPESLRRFISSLSESQLTERPATDEFSAQEQVCHLRDIEREGYSVRIRRILAEDEPSLPDIDGARLAIERDYNSEDCETALEEFASERNSNVGILRTLSDEQLNLAGTIAGLGSVTMERLLTLMGEHDRDHVDQLTALVRRLAS